MQFMLTMLDTANLAVRMTLELKGWQTLLHCPPVENPANVLDVGLHATTHQVWV